jgi:hypothetical protein
VTYFDCITVAVHRAQDWDGPSYLLPLTIVDEAALLAGLDSDRRGTATRY